MADLVVVDDDALITDFIAEVAQGLGMTMANATTLERAWAAIAGDTRVVLIDVYLGVESGTDLIARLSANTATAHIPVVAMTGSDDPEVLAQLDRLGVVALLPKPFDTAEATALLQAVIQTGPKNKRPPDGGP